MPLRLPWVLTFSDPNDECVRKIHLGDPTDVLRIRRRDQSPQAGQWAWTASRLKPADPDGMRRFSNADGTCDTKEEAQETAEAFYFKAGGKVEFSG